MYNKSYPINFQISRQCEIRKANNSFIRTYLHLLCEQDLSCYWHIYYTSTINAFAGWYILLHVLILALGVRIIHKIDGSWEEELFCWFFFLGYCMYVHYIILWQTLYYRDRIYSVWCSRLVAISFSYLYVNIKQKLKFVQQRYI